MAPPPQSSQEPEDLGLIGRWLEEHQDQVARWLEGSASKVGIMMDFWGEILLTYLEAVYIE